MRKLVMLNRTSLDGFFSGLNDEIDWFIHDHELDAAAHQLMNPNTLLMGRKTYEMFKGYWPHVLQDPQASSMDRMIAEELNAMRKIVFSKSLHTLDWQNAELATGNVVDTVRALKNNQGPDITIFGSGSIVQQLAAANLIDEYLVVLTPVILGKGRALFPDVDRASLALSSVQKFPSGNVLLHYAHQPV